MRHYPSGEAAFNQAVKNDIRANEYRNEWLDHCGMPSLVAYIRCITSQMPDVFPLDLTATGGFIVKAPDKREFSVVPFDTDNDDRWMLVVVEDDTGVRAMDLDMTSWKSEDDLIEKLFIWSRLHCPLEEMEALDAAERKADSMILVIRAEQAKTMPPRAPGRDADPF